MNRFPITPHFDYCFHPVHVIDETKDIIVPCGKCEGCLLHRANEWSMRIGAEIDSAPNSIFFTLTYNNFYLPKFRKSYSCLSNDGKIMYRYDNFDGNQRFNGVRNVPRIEDFDSLVTSDCIKIQNMDGLDYLAYSSKKDIQLWLKLLRKWLVTNLFNGDYDKAKSIRNERFRDAKACLFRYYVISEYGPTTFRPHCHGLIFPSNYEIAEAFISCGLYENWKMCDKTLFSQYTHYCDSGARNYVSQYITSINNLPKVYQENKEVRPFRLSSKAPAIGYVLQDKTEVFQGILDGTLEYTVAIPRLGTQSVLQRPKDFMFRLFPKCYRYGTLSAERISFIYGCLWKEIRRVRRFSPFVSRLFRAFLHPLDYLAAYACYNYCVTYGSCPDHYLYLLDSYHYLKEQRALKYFYEQQQEFMSKGDVISLIRYFINFKSFYYEQSFKLHGCNNALFMFLDSVGLRSADVTFLADDSFYTSDYDVFKTDYQSEVCQIVSGLSKIPKFNEKFGLAPHIV